MTNQSDQKKTNLNFVLGSVENIVGKGENAGNQQFLLFPQCFQRVGQSQDCMVNS